MIQESTIVQCPSSELNSPAFTLPHFKDFVIYSVIDQQMHIFRGEIPMVHSRQSFLASQLLPMRRGSAVGSPVSAAAGPGSSLRARRAPWPSAPKATLRPPSAKSSARARGRSNLVTSGRAELPGESLMDFPIDVLGISIYKGFPDLLRRLTLDFPSMIGLQSSEVPSYAERNVLCTMY